MIQNIETLYAGCRFRSRLEARWAVFFDRAGIEWEYEPQGLTVSCRLTGSDEHFNYLPDFWLPKLELWAEVKGSLTNKEYVQLLDTAASLSSNDGSGCHDSGGYDMLVLGPITRSSSLIGRTPIRLHFHKGSLLASGWPQEQYCGGIALANDSDSGTSLDDPYVNYELTERVGFLLRGHPADDIPDWFTDALTAARSARFEWGESG